MCSDCVNHLLSFNLSLHRHPSVEVNVFWKDTTQGLRHLHGNKGCFQTLLRNCFHLRLSMTWIVHEWRGGKVREKKEENAKRNSSFNALVN